MQKSIRKLYFIFIILSLIFMLFACNKPNSKIIADISLEQKDYYLTGTQLNSIKGNIIYNDGSKEEITADKLNLSGIDLNTEGVYNVSASYNGIEKTFVIKVKTLYTVNFVAGAGGMIKGTAVQQGLYGGETEVVEAVASPGYKFVKWSDNTKNNFHQPVKITESKEIVAIFELIRPVLSFYNYDVSSGQFFLNPANNITAEYNGSITVPDIEIEGYEFKGFSIDSKSAGLKTSVDGASNLVLKGAVLTNILINASYYPVYIPLKRSISVEKALKGSGAAPVKINTVQTENFKGCNLYKICNDNFAAAAINTDDFDYQWIVNDGISLKPVTSENEFTNYYITKNIVLTLSYFYKQKTLTYHLNSLIHTIKAEKFSSVKPYSALIAERADLLVPGKILNVVHNGTVYNNANDASLTINDNTDLNITYTDILYTVRFIDSIIQNENTLDPANPENEIISTVNSLLYNQKVARPSDSVTVKEGYIFKGWHILSDGKYIKYDFESPIHGIFDIYALYLVPYTVNFLYGTITLNYSDNPNETYMMTSGAKTVYFDYNQQIDNSGGNYNTVIYINSDGQYVKLSGSLVPVISSYVFEGWYKVKYTELYDTSAKITASGIIYALQDYEKYELVPAFTSGTMVLQCCEKKHDFTNEIIKVNDTVFYYKCSNPECTTFKVVNNGASSVLNVRRLSYVKMIYTMEKGKKLDSIQINTSNVTSTAAEYTSIVNSDESTTISFKKSLDDALFKISGTTKILPVKVINSYKDVTINITNNLNVTTYKNVTISASTGQFTATYNSDVLLTFIANEGFSVQNAIINGVMVSVGSEGGIVFDEANTRYYYTIPSIQSNCDISVITVERYHNVNINQNFNFTKVVKEDFETADTSIARYNSTKFISFRPDSLSEIISIKVNNIEYYNFINGILTPVNADSNLIFDRRGTLTDFYLTIKNISKNYLIDVIYSLKEMYYNITVTNGYLTGLNLNGSKMTLADKQSVFNSGDLQLTYGMSVSAQFAASDSTYILDYININGLKETELPSVITKNNDINIVYKKIQYTISFEVVGQGNNAGKYYAVTNSNSQTVQDPVVYDSFLNNPKTYNVIIGPPLNYEVMKVERQTGTEITTVPVSNNAFTVTENNQNIHYVITLKLHEYTVTITYTDSCNCGNLVFGEDNSDNYTADANGKRTFTVLQPYYTSRTLYINHDNPNASRVTQVIINGQYELLKNSYEINNITKDYNISVTVEKNKYTFEQPLADSRYTLSIQYMNGSEYTAIDHSKTYQHGTVIKLVMTSANYKFKEMRITYANLNNYDNYVSGLVYPETYIQYDANKKTYTCIFNFEGDICAKNLTFTLE